MISTLKCSGIVSSTCPGRWRSSFGRATSVRPGGCAKCYSGITGQGGVSADENGVKGSLPCRRMGRVAAVEFRILGPLEVADQGRPVALPGSRERIVLV